MDEYGIIKKMIDNEDLQGLIFDFDETLYTLETDWSGLKQALSEYSKTHFKNDTTFTPLAEVMMQFRNNKPEQYKELITITNRYELEGYSKGKPNKKLIELIRQSNSKKLAIYSMNADLVIKKFLKDYELEDLFHIIITQENALMPKPSDEDLNRICQSWKLASDKVLFIGNSQVDADSGIVADIKTILI